MEAEVRKSTDTEHLAFFIVLKCMGPYIVCSELFKKNSLQVQVINFVEHSPEIQQIFSVDIFRLLL